jgi:hypothetical protein
MYMFKYIVSFRYHHGRILMPGDEGKVMIAGGKGSTTGIYKSVYVLDMVTGRYLDLANKHTSRLGLQLVCAGDLGRNSPNS